MRDALMAGLERMSLFRKNNIRIAVFLVWGLKRREENHVSFVGVRRMTKFARSIFCMKQKTRMNSSCPSCSRLSSPLSLSFSFSLLLSLFFSRAGRDVTQETAKHLKVCNLSLLP